MLKQYQDFNVKYPFSTFNTDPHYNGRMNGVTFAIMQSDENKEKVLKRATQNLECIWSRSNAMLEALDYFNLTEADFTDSDYNELVQWVQEW